ncbi:MAG: hypothetical protein ACK4Q4_00835 [Rhodocyclaceae bacterium]
MNTTTQGNTEQTAVEDLAARFKAALDHRLSLAGLELQHVAKAVGRDPSTLRAHRRGANKLFYLDMEAYDDYFAAIGLPGLIDDVRSQRSWVPSPEPLSAAQGFEPARRLMQRLDGLRQAGEAHIEEYLAEHGLLPYAHILMRADAAIRTGHFGSKMASASALDPSIRGRDVRSLSDRAYGQFLHRHVHELLQAGGPVVHRIVAPMMTYRRLGVPVGNTLVAVSFDIEMAGAYRLT